jgi:hypothetical protein
MNKSTQIGLSIFTPIFSNILYNLSDGYYPMKYISLVNTLVIIGLVGTMIIQFYGTYLIIEKYSSEHANQEQS